MPSTSEKQRRFMAAAAHDPKFAAKAGIPQSVAQDFDRHDQGLMAAPKKKAKRAKHR